MTVCLFVGRIIQILLGWNFLKMNQKMNVGPIKIPLNFESFLDHCLDTKIESGFFHLVIITCLAIPLI